MEKLIGTANASPIFAGSALMRAGRAGGQSKDLVLDRPDVFGVHVNRSELQRFEPTARPAQRAWIELSSSNSESAAQARDLLIR